MNLVEIVSAVGATGLALVTLMWGMLWAMLRATRNDIVEQTNAKVDALAALTDRRFDALAALTDHRFTAIEGDLRPIKDALMGRALSDMTDTAN